MIKKFYYILLIVLIALSYLFFIPPSFKGAEIFYALNLSQFFVWANFFVCQDKVTMIFFFIVMLVTSLVRLFSEVYIEHYNNKKFFFLIILFFLSIITLIHGRRFIAFFLGWDGLGVSSICLIIFYPNIITIFNSFFTIFFNRLGDVILIFFISYFILNYSFCIFIFKDFPILICLILLACRFTKSAQFPLSAWLPAAISAPTPISAIVHSSTLVTAGVYLVSKSNFSFFNSNLIELLLFFRFLTFILGGFIANIEIDFKKVVAFSTIRQISIIMLILAIGLIWLAIAHTLFHAFFKTLLFCSTGLLFLRFFSVQIKTLFFSTKFSNFIQILFFLRIFMITGLIFSASFFRKDLVVEFSESSLHSFYYLLFIVGRIFTLLYSSKLIVVCHSTFSYYKIHSFKAYNFKFWLVYLGLIRTCGLLIKNMWFFYYYIVLRLWDVYLSLFLFLYSLAVLFEKFYSIFYLFTFNVSFIKVFSFRVFRNIFSLTITKTLSFSDIIFLKKFYLKDSSNNKKRLNNLNFYFLSFLILIVLGLY